MSEPKPPPWKGGNQPLAQSLEPTSEKPAEPLPAGAAPAPPAAPAPAPEPLTPALPHAPPHAPLLAKHQAPVGGYGVGLPPGVSPQVVEKYAVAQPKGPTNDNLAIASIVLGVFSLPGSFCCCGLATAPIGIVLGAVAYNQARAASRSTTLASVGLGLNIVALALFVLWQLMSTALSFLPVLWGP